MQISEGGQKAGGPQAMAPLLSGALSASKSFTTRAAISPVSQPVLLIWIMTSGLQSSDLVIVAGRPSMGKTSFAMNLVENAAPRAIDLSWFSRWRCRPSNW